MGVLLTKKAADEIFSQWVKKYDVFAPMVMKGEGCFSDQDVIRYGKPSSLDEIEWDKKSEYSFKETLLAINETIFYFTENQTTVPEGPKKDLLIFLKACDLNALKRLDQIYLDNTFGDFYYARIREKAKFVLMGCDSSCESGFCVTMGTNKAENYDLSLKVQGDAVYADVKNEQFAEVTAAGMGCEYTPASVTENKEQVTLPKHPETVGKDAPIWKEYGARCINCGRCNFACPTCTCFTMQDIFYSDNANAGERRRVWASCQVDDFDTIAGGIKFRKDNADRVRYKVLHKVSDFGKRFGYSMCVGCGRCIDICPEYISYTTLLTRLAKEEEK